MKFKPFVVLALPGMYLFYKYNQYKRQQQEQNRRKVTERELAQLNHKIDKLLSKLDEHEPEVATCQEDEQCVICVNAKATMQTYPCGHRVVCRKCFVKTIQVAVSQRLLPLRCVICRAKILRLKQTLANSASEYSIGISNSASAPSFLVAQSASLYSMTSASSSISGVSAYSSASSASTSSMKPAKSSSSKHKISYHQTTGPLKKSQSQIVKGAKPTTGGYVRLARTPSPSPTQPLLPVPQAATARGKNPSESNSAREGRAPSRSQYLPHSNNKVAPNDPPRLTAIKEFQREFQREFRASKERIAKDVKASNTAARGRAYGQHQQNSFLSEQHVPASKQVSRSHSAPIKLSQKEEKRKEAAEKVAQQQQQSKVKKDAKTDKSKEEKQDKNNSKKEKSNQKKK